MALFDDLTTEVGAIFRSQWDFRNGYVIPETKDIATTNEGVRIEAAVLYADLSDSTPLVDSYDDWLAAEIYKAFLRCSAKIIRSEGGEIRSYDGDRVMGLFRGDDKERRAARTALKINHAVKVVVRPAFEKQYPETSIEINHCVGVDVSSVMAVRAGIRGSNDLAWIGRAANHAAKLTSLPHTHPSRITAAVYDRLSNAELLGGPEKKPMWEKRLWTPMNNAEIYRSNWRWKP